MADVLGTPANDLIHKSGDGETPMPGENDLPLATDQVDNLQGFDGDDRIFGGDGGDTIGGRNGDDELFGQGGNDIISGNNGNDTLDGGADDDELDGGEGNDILRGGPGNDILLGGLDNDTLFASPGEDTLDGGPGSNVVIYDGTDAATVDFNAGTIVAGATNNTFVNARRVITGDGADIIIGSPNGQSVVTGGGSDMINMGAGQDTVEPGGGDDQVDGGFGGITSFSNDTVGYNGLQEDHDIIFNGDGSITVIDLNPSDGDNGTDTLTNIENLFFGTGLGSSTFTRVDLTRQTVSLTAPEGTTFAEGTNALFQVSLSNPTTIDKEIRLSLEVADNSSNTASRDDLDVAAAGFSSQSQSVKAVFIKAVFIPAGESTVTFELPILTNADAQALETFSVVILEGTIPDTSAFKNTYDIDPSAARVDIQVVEAAAPIINAPRDRVDVAEGDTGETDLTFTVTREGDLSAASSVAFTVTPGDADPVAPEDFVGGTLPSGTVTFSPGEAVQTITVDTSKATRRSKPTRN